MVISDTKLMSNDDEVDVILEAAIRGDIRHGEFIIQKTLRLYRVPPDVWHTICIIGSLYIEQNKTEQLNLRRQLLESIQIVIDVTATNQQHPG